MKIIELLNKIANGEEVPKKIKYKNIEYEYEDIGYYNKQRGYLFDGYYVDGILNDEVEILDKENKIEKLSILTFSDLMNMEKEDLVVVIKEQRFKINKLIDEVNKLKESDK